MCLSLCLLVCAVLAGTASRRELPKRSRDHRRPVVAMPRPERPERRVQTERDRCERHNYR
ncbi:hypothetical protein F3J20_17420 [Paraburkholderia sp. Cy-641]|nr:hypothetical protein [Paraburkholderia sp. Cy-641]